jgi:hypothetical protein
MGIRGFNPNKKEDTEQLGELARMKIARTQFNEASDEMTPFLKKKSNERFLRFHEKKFTTKEGYLNLRPRHLVEEIRRIQEIQQRREEKWEKHKRFNKEGKRNGKNTTESRKSPTHRGVLCCVALCCKKNGIRRSPTVRT